LSFDDQEGTKEMSDPVREFWIEHLVKNGKAAESFLKYVDQRMLDTLQKHHRADKLEDHKRINGALDTWLTLRGLVRSYKNEQDEDKANEMEMAMARNQGAGGRQNDA